MADDLVSMDELERQPWPFPAEQPVTALVPVQRDARRSDDDADAFEVLGWHRADQRKPDSDITVICWMADGEWFSGWWDSTDECWRDAASGGRLEVVTHWAEPEGPRC